MRSKQISQAVIKRLPRYYRYLGDLLVHGVTRISSKELSERMNVTASQIRQDLNNFGAFGQQGYGYNVELLYNEIRLILGIEKTYRLIIIGAGNIGKALANYAGFGALGFDITAFFESDKQYVGRSIKNVPIYDTETLKDYLSKNKTDIAIIATPGSSAKGVAGVLFESGVRGIWNFTNTDLHAPAGAAVENVNLTDSLMTLTFQMNQQR